MNKNRNDSNKNNNDENKNCSDRKQQQKHTGAWCRILVACGSCPLSRDERLELEMGREELH
eukprot:5093141-Amphidinium_carterae.1